MQRAWCLVLLGEMELGAALLLLLTRTEDSTCSLVTLGLGRLVRLYRFERLSWYRSFTSPGRFPELTPCPRLCDPQPRLLQAALHFAQRTQVGLVLQRPWIHEPNRVGVSLRHGVLSPRAFLPRRRRCFEAVLALALVGCPWENCLPHLGYLFQI